LDGEEAACHEACELLLATMAKQVDSVSAQVPDVVIAIVEDDEVGGLAPIHDVDQTCEFLSTQKAGLAVVVDQPVGVECVEESGDRMFVVDTGAPGRRAAKETNMTDGILCRRRMNSIPVRIDVDGFACEFLATPGDEGLVLQLERLRVPEDGIRPFLVDEIR